MEEDRICWICLCGADGSDTAETAEEDQVVRVCACPRLCHKRCLGRWQLQNAGKREEKYCRFCQQRYPDWRNSLTPGELTPSTPVMAVSVRGKVYKLRVRPGPEGKEDFKRQIRQLLGFSQDMDFDVIFECKTPHNGAEKVQLHGFDAFEAASWCAAVSAAKRKKAKQAAAAAAAAASSSDAPLTTSVSCPAPNSRPSSSGSSSGRNSSAGGSATVAAAPSATNSSCDTAAAALSSQTLAADGAVQPDQFVRDPQPAADTSIAASAFATATAAAAAGAAGMQQQQQSLLNTAMSTPAGFLTTMPSSSSVGPFGLQPAPSHFLRTAGSSMPHAIVEEPLPASPPAGSAVVADISAQHRDLSGCPDQLQLQDTGSEQAFIEQQLPPAAAPALTAAMSVPVGVQATRAPHSSSSSSGSGTLRRSSSAGGSSDGEVKSGSKVSRFLRRLLHMEGPWRGAVPAGVMFGIL